MKSSTPTIKITKADVVAKAREYLGTPFQHAGRVKGLSCDCIGLPLQVACELGLKDKLGVPFNKSDSKNYSPQPLDGAVHEEAQRRLIEKPISEMCDGDMLTIKMPVVACHTAIVCTTLGRAGIIHAYNGGPKRVVEQLLDEKWRSRIAGVFSFPGVE
jgi:NlpC/P60 family putative phage cell wall peptidase